MECMKSIDKKRKEAGVYEGRESLKTWANIAKSQTNEEETRYLLCGDLRKKPARWRFLL